MQKNPKIYDNWYKSTRGRWIAEQEFSVLLKLFTPNKGQTLLDVGCGTGYFSQRFNQFGMQVTGIDPDPAMLKYAQDKNNQITYIEGDALNLPFSDNSFDYCSAVTSLCFIAEPVEALSEMLRVSRHGVMLGLLNRHSLLHIKKQHSISYKGARWDTTTEVQQWCDKLKADVEMMTKSAVWIPSAGILARSLEMFLTDKFPYGSFLAVGIKK